MKVNAAWEDDEASSEAVAAAACARCARPYAGRHTFVMSGEPMCLRCALRHRPMLRRSVLTMIVVGTIFVGINQGTVLLAGEFPMELWWKIPLTYCVPFCVATFSAIINNRRLL